MGVGARSIWPRPPNYNLFLNDSTNYKPSMEAEEMFRARSLQMLQENRFMDRYKLSGRMLEPNSQPTYFADLVREIEEAPKRTWFERLGKKLSGMVRLQ